MTDFYSDLASVADELLREFGQECSLTSLGTSNYSPATGLNTPAGEASQDVIAAVFDFPMKYVDGTMIKVGDKRVVMSSVGLTFDAAPGQTFTDATSRNYKVIDAKNIAPAGTSVAWILQVRK